MSTRLIHNPAATRFEIYLNDVLAGFADYADHDKTKTRDFNHTMTFPEFRGRGVAAQVVDYALKETRAAGYTVIPTCWYVDEYISTHPEYALLTH